MMKFSFPAAAALGLLFCSCGSGNRIDPERLDYEPTFRDDGTAVAMIDEMFVVINRDYEAITPLCTSLHELSFGYTMASPADGSRSRLYDASYNAVDSAARYITDVSESGVIWRDDLDGCVSARNLRTGRDVFAEKDVDVVDVTVNGTVVLRRVGAHKEELRLTGELKPAYDYMIADADGAIKAPWGKYRYIESFSHGRAKFTNGAYYCQWRTGHFAKDDFNDCGMGTRKFGYIDEAGNVVIPERYEMCDAFDSDGHARADGVTGDVRPNIIIDMDGNVVGHYRPRRGGLY